MLLPNRLYIIMGMLCIQLLVGSPSFAGNHPDVLSIQVFSEARYDNDSSVIVIPFSRAGNLILVRARADSIEGNFILDTGCPHLVLNMTYFRHYETTWEQDEQKGGMTGEIATALQTVISNFRFGGSDHYRVKTDLVNLGHIENSKGVKILGLIGMQLLDRYEMIIDFERSQIHLRRANRKDVPASQNEMLRDTSAYHTIPIEMKEDRIIVKTELAGKKIRLIIDSGAESNVLDSRLPDKVFEQVSINGRIILTGAGNKKVEALRGDLQTLVIGGQRVNDLPVMITNLEKTCFSYGGCVDGILGFDFLSLQKIGFNFVTRKMYLWK